MLHIAHHRQIDISWQLCLKRSDVHLRLQEEASMPINPSAGTAVLRAVLLGPNVSEGLWVLLLTLHRVAGDHHSLALLGEQLAAAYAALKGGSKAHPAAGLQFLDVLHWQRQPQQLQKYEPQHLFWLRQLAYAPPQLFLPYDDLCPNDAGARPATARSVTFMVRLQPKYHGTINNTMCTDSLLCNVI